jgi:hypothetical protein
MIPLDNGLRWKTLTPTVSVVLKTIETSEFSGPSFQPEQSEDVATLATYLRSWRYRNGETYFHGPTDSEDALERAKTAYGVVPDQLRSSLEVKKK